MSQLAVTCKLCGRVEPLKQFTSARMADAFDQTLRFHIQFACAGTSRGVQPAAPAVAARSPESSKAPVLVRKVGPGQWRATAVSRPPRSRTNVADLPADPMDQHSSPALSSIPVTADPGEHDGLTVVHARWWFTRLSQLFSVTAEKKKENKKIRKNGDIVTAPSV